MVSTSATAFPRSWSLNAQGGVGTPILIVLTACFVRAITFGNPVPHVDEAFYFTTASAMLDGARLYVDIWDRKPVGLFLIYLLPALAGAKAGIYAYQALALLSVIATALLVRHIARAAGWDRGALPAALIYILWLNLAEGQGGQSPVFYNLPMAFSACCLIKAGNEDGVAQSLKWGLMAMLLTGLALQIKYSAIFEGIFFGLWLLYLEWRRRPSATLITAKGLLLALTALAPTIAAGLWYAAAGHWQDFYFANFESILGRKSSPPAELAGNAVIVTLILAPLLALACWPISGSEKPEGLTHRFLRSWLIAALAGLVLFGTWFDHYSLPVMLPAACCAAAFFAEHPRGRALALPILAFVALAGQALLLQKRVERGTTEQAHRIMSAIGPGKGCLFIYSGPTIFYPLTGRCRLSKYVFPSHLHRQREEGATGVSQKDEVERILERVPEVVLVSEGYQGENPQVRKLAVGFLDRDYQLVASLPLGKDTVRIFRCVQS